MPTIKELSDREIVARTIWGEARGEGVEGMRAVAAVIANRVRADLAGDGRTDWWGEGWRGVCLARFQFSCWNENDANRARMLEARNTSLWMPEALAIADEAMSGRLVDPTGGATHYFADYITPPAWAKGFTRTVKIGRHIFFRDPAAVYPAGVSKPERTPRSGTVSAPAPVAAAPAAGGGLLAALAAALRSLFGRSR